MKTVTLLYIVFGIILLLNTCKCVDSCFGFLSTDPSVCSSVGACTAPDTCMCPITYNGISCENPSCNSLFGPLACNGFNGECISLNTCQCFNGFTGPLCSIPPTTPLLTFSGSNTQLKDLYYKTIHQSSITCNDLIPYIKEEIRTLTKNITVFNGVDYSCTDGNEVMMVDMVSFRNYLIERQSECYSKVVVDGASMAPFGSIDDLVTCFVSPNFPPSSINPSKLLYTDPTVDIYHIEHHKQVEMEINQYSDPQIGLTECGSNQSFNITCEFQYELTPPRSLYVFNTIMPALPTRIKLYEVSQGFSVGLQRSSGESSRVSLKLDTGIYPQPLNYISSSKKQLSISANSSPVIIASSNTLTLTSTNCSVPLLLEIDNIEFSGLNLLDLNLVSCGDVILLMSGNNLVHNDSCSTEGLMDFNLTGLTTTVNLVDNIFTNHRISMKLNAITASNITMENNTLDSCTSNCQGNSVSNSLVEIILLSTSQTISHLTAHTNNFKRNNQSAGLFSYDNSVLIDTIDQSISMENNLFLWKNHRTINFTTDMIEPYNHMIHFKLFKMGLNGISTMIFKDNIVRYYTIQDEFLPCDFIGSQNPICTTLTSGNLVNQALLNIEYDGGTSIAFPPVNDNIISIDGNLFRDESPGQKSVYVHGIRIRNLNVPLFGKPDVDKSMITSNTFTRLFSVDKSMNKYHELYASANQIHSENIESVVIVSNTFSQLSYHTLMYYKNIRTLTNVTLNDMTLLYETPILVGFSSPGNSIFNSNTLTLLDTSRMGFHLEDHTSVTTSDGKFQMKFNSLSYIEMNHYNFASGSDEFISESSVHRISNLFNTFFYSKTIKQSFQESNSWSHISFQCQHYSVPLKINGFISFDDSHGHINLKDNQFNNITNNYNNGFLEYCPLVHLYVRKLSVVPVTALSLILIEFNTYTELKDIIYGYRIQGDTDLQELIITGESSTFNRIDFSPLSSMEKVPSMYQVLRTDGSSMDSIEFNQNSMSFEDNTLMSFISLFTYLPEYYTNVTSLEENGSPALYFTTPVTLSYMNITNNYIQSTQSDPLDTLKGMIELSGATYFAGQYLTSRIGEVEDISRSFIWTQLTSHTLTDAYFINNTYHSVNSGGLIPHNIHTTTQRQIDSLIYIHDYQNIATILYMSDNKVTKEGTFISSVVSGQPLRVSIRIGILLTGNIVTINELVLIFKPDLLAELIGRVEVGDPLPTQDITTTAIIKLPYQSIGASISKENPELLDSYVYDVKIEPPGTDMYAGTDQCHYSCKNYLECDKCVLTDYAQPLLIQEYSLAANGLCYQRSVFSVTFEAMKDCSHEKLLITEPYQNLETFLITTRNEYNNSLIVKPRTNGFVRFIMNDQLQTTLIYDEFVYNNVVTSLINVTYHPFVFMLTNSFSPVFTKLNNLQFDNIDFRLDSSNTTVNNINRLFFSTYIDSSSVKYAQQIPTLEKFSIINSRLETIDIGSTGLISAYFAKYMFLFKPGGVGILSPPLYDTYMQEIGEFELINNTITGFEKMFRQSQFPVDQFTMINNNMDTIIGGAVDMLINKNFVIEDNICTNCIHDTVSDSILFIQGNPLTQSLHCINESVIVGAKGICSLQRNNFNVSNIIFDVAGSTTVYRVESFNNTILIDDNIDNRRLSYGMCYTNINSSFTCDFPGMRDMKLRNLELKGNVADIACFKGTVSEQQCTGIACLTDQTNDPQECLVNKSLTIENPGFFYTQFPSWQTAFDFCRAKNPKHIKGLCDVYHETELSINFQDSYINSTTHNNETLLLEGLGCGVLADKPIIVGNNHLVKKSSLILGQGNGVRLNLEIKNLQFVNPTAFIGTSPTTTINRDDFIISTQPDTSIDDLKIIDSCFWGIRPVTTIPTLGASDFQNVTVWQNLLQVHYFDEQLSGTRPAISNSNTNILVSMQVKRSSNITRNRFHGSYQLGYDQLNIIDSSNGTINYALSKAFLSHIEGNIGENQWGGFIRLLNQYNVNYEFNECTVFCGAFSDQSLISAITQIGFSDSEPNVEISPGVPFTGALHASDIQNNTWTALFVPSGNIYVPSNRIAFQSITIPVIGFGGYFTSLWISDLNPPSNTEVSKFINRGNRMNGMPVAYRMSDLSESMIINVGEPFGNVPLFSDSKRDMREQFRNNELSDILGYLSGSIFDVRKTDPVGDIIPGEHLFCNDLCPPDLSAFAFCEVSNAFIEGVTIDFGILKFTNLTDAFYRCIYNRVIMLDPDHFEHLDITRMNYRQDYIRAIPTDTFTIESSTTQRTVIHGFQHNFHQFDDGSSNHLIDKVQFQNIEFRMSINGINGLPYDGISCDSIPSPTNFRFSSIINLIPSPTNSTVFEVDLFSFDDVEFKFDFTDITNSSNRVINETLRCDSVEQGSHVIAVNCDLCKIKDLKMNSVSMTSIDAITPLSSHPVDLYGLMLLRMRLDGSIATSHSDLYKPTITNVDQVISQSMSSRKFIDLQQVQSFFIDTVIAPTCNPNPLETEIVPYSAFDYSCISIETPSLTGIDKWFTEPSIYMAHMRNVQLGSIYLNSPSIATLVLSTNTYNTPTTVISSDVPFKYSGITWVINAPIVAGDSLNIFHFNIAVLNITGNIVGGTSIDSRIDTGFHLVGPLFNTSFSCQNNTGQVSGYANATSLGFQASYASQDLVRIISLANPDTEGQFHDILMGDKDGYVLSELCTLSTSTFSCLFCDDGCPGPSFELIKYLICTLFILLLLTCCFCLTIGNGWETATDPDDWKLPYQYFELSTRDDEELNEQNNRVKELRVRRRIGQL